MMGVSALDYINKVRIMNAAELIQKTDDPLHEIISKTGFISESTFNRNFKNIRGCLQDNGKKNMPERNAG